MADQTNNKVTETKAETLPATAPVKAPASEPAKAEPAKAELAKAEPVKAAAAAAKAVAPKAKAPAKAASRTVKARKPAKKKPVSVRKAKPAKKPVVKTAKPARAAAKAIKQGANIMANRTNKAAETGQVAADQIRNAFGDINARAKTAAEKSAKIVEELTDLTRGNVEAFVASSKIAAKGVETLGQDAADYSRKSFEEASAALKSFAEVKSATDFFRLQGDFARSAFDSAVAESARLSETVLKLAGDVAEPINSRYTVATQRVKTLAA